MIFFGSNKSETISMIFFHTKHRYTDISGFARGNPDFYLHCFGIFAAKQPPIPAQRLDSSISGKYFCIKFSDSNKTFSLYV